MNPHANLIEPLHVLIANGDPDRLQQVARSVISLGHRAIAVETEPGALREVTTAERPDVSIVIVGDSSARSLELIGKMVKEAVCPVIALLDVEDPEFIKEAAKRGVFAYITHAEPAELQSSLDIVLRRFAEYHNLEGAFSRRAMTERAKGILMERHDIDERQAFDILRDKARQTDRKVVDIAEAVVLSRGLLPSQRPSTSLGEERINSEAASS